MGERTLPPAERKKRLRAALRENLKRRKAQARHRGSPEEKPATGAPPANDNKDTR